MLPAGRTQQRGSRPGRAWRESLQPSSRRRDWVPAPESEDVAGSATVGQGQAAYGPGQEQEQASASAWTVAGQGQRTAEGWSSEAGRASRGAAAAAGAGHFVGRAGRAAAGECAEHVVSGAAADAGHVDAAALPPGSWGGVRSR